MTLTDPQRRDVAAELRAAERSRVPIAPLATRWPGLALSDAYAIQLANLRARLDAGARVSGH